MRKVDITVNERKYIVILSAGLTGTLLLVCNKNMNILYKRCSKRLYKNSFPDGVYQTEIALPYMAHYLVKCYLAQKK